MRNRGTVLIIDDNREIVFGTTLRLRAAGYQPLTAFGGREGIEIARQKQPDAIILDVLMPEIDGLETMRILKQSDDAKHIPVVMLSASLRDKQRALDDGARFFLTKPCPSEDLLTAVTTAIRESVCTVED